MVFRGKKGEAQNELYYRLLEVALVAFFAAAWLAVFQAHAGDTSFFRDYYSRDTALLIDGMHSLPGNATINYSVKEVSEPLQFVINDGAVSVYEYPRKSATPITYFYARDNNITVKSADMVPKEFDLIKKGDVIRLNETAEVNVSDG